MNETSRLLTTFLLNALWQITIIAALAVLTSKLLRRMPSRYAHATWVLALAACLLLPLTTLFIHRDIAADVRAADATTNTYSAISSSVTPTKTGFSLSFHSLSHSVSLSPLWMRGLLWTYIVLLLFQVTRLGWSCYRTAQLRTLAYSRPLPPTLARVAERCMQAFSLPQTPVLCLPGSAGPATLGFHRPVLILPESFFTDSLSEEDLSSALSHELAHIRRHDFLFNLLFEIMSVPISFHPGAALIKAKIAQTRELACDEIAAPMLPSTDRYARSLLHIAQSIVSSTPSKSNYALGLFDTNALEERIMNLLNAAKASDKWARASRVMAACLVGAVSLGIAAFSLNIDSANTASDLQKFVGTWEAKYKGKTFFTLKLTMKDGTLGGTCIHVERLGWIDGELIPTSDEITTDRVLEAHASGQKLSLKIDHGTDSTDAFPFELTLIGKNVGEGKVIGKSSSGAPDQEKPWHFQRISAAP